MTNNEQITKLRERYRKNGQSPFLFNTRTGEIKSSSQFTQQIPVRVDLGTRIIETTIRCGGNWRFVTDEYYPVFAGEKYVSWCPFGFEDMKFEEEMRTVIA